MEQAVVTTRPAKSPERTDTLRRIELPEGVEIHVHVAGPIPRAMAWLIDICIFAVCMLVIWIVSLLVAIASRTAAQGIVYIGLFILITFYDLFFEMRRGSTPGKKAMGLRVTQPSGAPVTWGQSFVRNLLRIADFLPFGYLNGFIASMSNRNFQRLGDMLAGTVVSYVDHLQVRRRSDVLLDRDPLPPTIPLARDEQFALVEFADRIHMWTPERREELANHAEALTGVRDAEATEALLDMAAWLMETR